MLGSVLDGLDSWLVTPDASVEKQAVDKAISRLAEGNIFLIWLNRLPEKQI